MRQGREFWGVTTRFVVMAFLVSYYSTEEEPPSLVW